MQLSDAPRASVGDGNELSLSTPAQSTPGTSVSTLPSSGAVPHAAAHGHTTAPSAPGEGGRSTPSESVSPAATTDGAPLSGRGFTDKTIKMGIVTASGEGAFASGLGVSDSSGDLMAQYDVMQHYINAHGGIAGRKLVLVNHTVDFGTAVNNPSLAAQEVCAAFTQDSHVFAVFNPVPTAAQRTCLEQANTPIIDSGTLLVGAPNYTQHPDLLFSVGKMTTDLVDRLLMQSLAARHFFSGWNPLTGAPGPAPPKLGLLYPDQPDAKYNVELEVRELRAMGLTVSDTVTYPANVTAGLAATQSAVLKFKAEGITHVLGESVFFMEDAQSQGYYPRYVIPIGAALGYAPIAPAKQMVGSMTVGYQPAGDVDAQRDPGPVSPAQTRCTRIMRKAGQSPSARAALQSMEAVCDVMFFLQASLSGATGLSNVVLEQGANRLGTGWKSAQTFVSDFSPQHHASAIAVRDMTYFTSCSCMKYVGGLRE